MERQQIGLKLALDALGYDLDLSAFDRRLILQKLVYLVQAAKVDLGYTFGWYLRGPYSPGLTRDAFALKAELTRNADELKGWKFDAVSLDRLARLREAFRAIPEAQRASHLELLASVHFLFRTRQATSTDVAGLQAVLLRNGKDFSEAAIRQAIEDLKQHDLFRPRRDKLIVDAIHGDIRLKPLECAVIDTASFQRLRHLKQLQFGHVTYPGATHTRFAHSIGVLGIMARITDVARDVLTLTAEQVEDIRLADLLHDIGHYPYSHLMEKVDKVTLTEEMVAGGPKTIGGDRPRYPKHEEIGESVVTGQDDVLRVLGEERAIRVANLFRRTAAADPQLSKLVHSSLDMDRLDYLLRDAKAAGVPFGQVDLNYLLNNFHASPTGAIGVPEKAITAVDHFLLGRFFMYRSVYYHKTTFGLEEACRQLLRRGRDAGKFGIPADGDAVRVLVRGPRLGSFTDAFVDRIIEEAAGDSDPVIKALAGCIRRRRPPKLLREELVLKQSGTLDHAGVIFKKDCKHNLPALAQQHGLPLGRLLVCETPPLTLEKRGALMTEADAKSLDEPEKEEIIRVFVGDRPEPVSVVDVPHSIAHLCSNHFFQAFRLYLVPDDDTDEAAVERLRNEVKGW